MAVLHITREKAVREIESVLEQAKHGTEIVIDSEDGTDLVIRAASAENDSAFEHDRWVREILAEALQDNRPAISNEEMNAQMQQRRAAARTSHESKAS